MLKPEVGWMYVARSERNGQSTRAVILSDRVKLWPIVTPREQPEQRATTLLHSFLKNFHAFLGMVGQTIFPAYCAKPCRSLEFPKAREDGKARSYAKDACVNMVRIPRFQRAPNSPTPLEQGGLIYRR